MTARCPPAPGRRWRRREGERGHRTAVRRSTARVSSSSCRWPTRRRPWSRVGPSATETRGETARRLRRASGASSGRRGRWPTRRSRTISAAAADLIVPRPLAKNHDFLSFFFFFLFTTKLFPLRRYINLAINRVDYFEGVARRTTRTKKRFSTHERTIFNDYFNMRFRWRRRVEINDDGSRVDATSDRLVTDRHHLWRRRNN